MIEIGSRKRWEKEEIVGHDNDMKRGTVGFNSVVECLFEMLVSTKAFESICLGALVPVEHLLLEEGNTSVVSEGVGFQTDFNILNEMFV